MDYAKESIKLHRKLKGKISIESKVKLETRDDLSLAYTPGVAAASSAIADDPSEVWELTGRGNLVAIVSDGSAVLGLGNIGPEASLPVMEGKAVLFKEFAGIDAIPIVLNTQDVDEIVETVARLEPSFGGINLEDISSPRCFEIEKRLREMLDIPVFHDDQHGTAIVVMAGLINAAKVVGKDLKNLRVVISGAGAAGIAITKFLCAAQGACNTILVDSKGIISKDRDDLSDIKKSMLDSTNPTNMSGSLADAMKDADVFIGVSAPNIVNKEMVQSMADKAIVFTLANPIPEIMPDLAKEAGAAVVATGRSDFPNQVNNVLAFPGIFRGAFDARASAITEKMKIAAAQALAESVIEVSADKIIPDVLDKTVAKKVAEAVKRAAL